MARTAFASFILFLILASATFGQTEYMSSGQSGLFVSGSVGKQDQFDAWGVAAGATSDQFAVTFGWTSVSLGRGDNVGAGSLNLTLFGPNNEANALLRPFVDVGMAISNSWYYGGTAYITTVGFGLFARPIPGNNALQFLVAGSLGGISDKPAFLENTFYGVDAGVEYALKFRSGAIPISFIVSRDITNSVTSYSLGITLLSISGKNAAVEFP